MNSQKSIESWRAEQIARVFLRSNGIIELPKHFSNGHDITGYSILRPDKKIYFEVKATKYSKREIIEKFKKDREKILHQNSASPVVMFYINYDNESGYFEILKQNHREEILPLEVYTFNHKMEELIHG